MGDGGVFGPKRDEANSQPHFIVLVLVPAAIESNVGSYTYENTGEKYTNPRRQVCVDTIGYEPKDRVGRLTMTSGTTRLSACTTILRAAWSRWCCTTTAVAAYV